MNVNQLRQRLFINVSEFSALFGCDERTARRGIDAGEIPAVRIGRTVRIPVPAVLDLLGLPHDMSEAGPDSPAIAATATRSLEDPDDCTDRNAAAPADASLRRVV